MKNNFLVFLKKPVTVFIIKTVIFFAIFLVLIYIYGYNGVGSAKFIYNEF
ncbi:teichoic acid D-Ala incorporation-associated protein DltX [Companilactobacillus alimentarius]|uniref:Cytochrome C554 n=1 Tax=Companilactobacillus alimentarius DSM 20249 TaxID=1423720 RepID=A0A2K9HJC5_9LACO|nr:teichoic acid D-Ala incorporation-associated protein DltX [Companilactobacillus alimentarius]AUI71866.1 cytochrome C554 [Companilactobacillus alimentarius DSM 20249]MDT6952397.1 teichoic acid D-Ala incorporation-associated protein DltX [Companilactobacillus alimentarius]GEO45133.1 cytochrome c554 [Companilactobacillus alimentarius]